MWKIKPLLPCAATALTLAIVPAAQAVVMIPTPFIPAGSIVPAENSFNDGEPPSNAGLLIKDIVVQTSANFASVYEACFEYGLYVDIFNANRPPACVDVASLNTPQFLNQMDLAILAGGAISSPPPDFEPTSNGMLTALNNAVVSGVQRTQGKFYFDLNENGIIEVDNLNPPVDDASSEVGDFEGTIVGYSVNTFMIPYSLQDINNTPGDLLDDQVTGVLGTYNPHTGTWSIDTDNTTFSGDLAMHVRFRQTRTINLNPVQSTPEPSSWVGILLGGISLLVTRRFRRR